MNKSLLFVALVSVLSLGMVASNSHAAERREEMGS